MLSLNTGVQKIYGLKSLLGDHYLWSDHKKRNQILDQFAAASFVVAEIIRCRLYGDKLYWRRTKFQLVAYISNLLGSYNVQWFGQRNEEDAGHRWCYVLTKALPQLPYTSQPNVRFKLSEIPF